jgi:V/A-type H+/Na+-transporting ATPase subunit I
MGILRPLPMVKVGVLGLKDDREVLLSTLHDLGLVQVEPAGKATLEELPPERTSELQRTVSDQLIRFRGLKAALPATPVARGRSFRTLEEILDVGQSVPIDAEVGDLKREEDRKRTERAQVQETLDLLQRFAFYRDRLEYLNARSLLAFFGEAPTTSFAQLQAELPGLSNAAQFLVQPSGDSTLFVLAVPTAQAETVGHLAQQRGIKLFPVPKLSGTMAEEGPGLVARRTALDQRLGEIDARLTEISRSWFSAVVHLEEALTIENRKFEIFPKLAAGRSTFAVEGWLPKRDLPRLETTLQAVSNGRVHFYEIPSAEEPPTFMENPPGIRWYEFFIRFYSLPQATEWDPTFTFAIVFPILFGLMLGDVGYATVILGFCLWMIAGFPGGRHLPKSLTGFLTNIMGASSMRKLAFALVPGTLVGIAVGVLTNSYFGFSLGYQPLFTPLNNTGSLLLFAGFLGLAMVLYGFGLGALKEYFHHRYGHALGKVGGILIAVGIVGFGLGLLRSQLDFSSFGLTFVYLGLIVAGVVTMILTVGVMETGMGFIDALSHILSYTRLVGILLASVILALVANGIAVGSNSRSGAIFSGSVVGVVFGLLILLVVQVFNVVLGVFEPGIQGARLIFVEHFSKFYTGNGRPFQPFASPRTATQSAHVPPKVG